MIRRSLVLCAFAISSASVLAQESARSMLRQVTSPVRNAGIYHFGLGTWTRHADTADAINQDILYSNSCPTGYFQGLFTNEYVADEGRTPGPNGPVKCDTGLLSTNKGCNCVSTITGFEIGYCSGLPGLTPVSINVGFQSAYVACAVPNPLPQGPGTFDLTGLPGAGLSTKAAGS